MSNCCPKQGLLKDIGPIIEGLRSENDRMVATCVVMALVRFFRDHHGDFIVDVAINGNIITFTKNDGTTIDIELPLDEYVNGAEISGKNLILKRHSGNNIIIDLSRFFASCTLNGDVVEFKNVNGDVISSITLKDTYIDNGSLEYNNEDDEYSIQLDYNDTNKESLEIPLNDFQASILSKFPLIPGYYKSKNFQNQSVAQFNTLNTEYLGTTWDPKTQQPTFQFQYIYKVISKNEYVLVAQYKVPRDGYYYVLSSGISNVRYNKEVDGNIDEKSKKIPGGVIAIVKQNGDNLQLERSDKFFIYLTLDTNTTPSSITYSNIINNNPTFTVEGTDNLGGQATAEHCMFYPSRFISNGVFSGRHNWNPDTIDNFEELVDQFNNLIMQSGYRYLFEIKYENTVNNVDILKDQSESVINGDISEGIRYTGIRQRLLGKYIGKARLSGSNYITAGQWFNEHFDSNYFNLTNYNNWEDKETLEFIWSYIMTNYFNCLEPDGAISNICYSDNTGWYTTWANLCILNRSFGLVINANTECADGEVVNPGNDYLPNISDTNLPCSNFQMVFNIQNNQANIKGWVKLNVGSRKWEINSETPYRYFQFSKVNSEGVIIDLFSLLYKTTLKECNFIVERKDNGELISENVLYNNGDANVTVTTLKHEPTV